MSKFAQYTGIIDRTLDRWESAIEAARAASYSSGQFTKDVAESWNDWALFATLQLSVFGLAVSARPAVPTVEFIVTDKAVKSTLVVQVPQINNVTSAATANLTRGPGSLAAPYIPMALVTATLAGTEHLYVTLDSPAIAALSASPGPITANVYGGNIQGMAANVTIARVKVVWPG